MKLKEVTEYLKKHKEVILIVAGTAIVGIVGCKVYQNHHSSTGSKLISPITDTIIFNSMDIGEVTAAWDEDGFTNIILNDVPLGDLGKLGEELSKIRPDTNEAYLMLGIKNVE